MQILHKGLFNSWKQSLKYSVIIWILNIILCIFISCYNDYLTINYLKNGKIDILSALKVIGDKYYLIYFILGILGIISLVLIFLNDILYGIRNSKDIIKELFLSAITIFILIILLVIYSNPILITFAMVLGLGCILMLVQ